jgi:hypothetical protein
MEYIHSLSTIQIYFICLAISLILSWVIQYTDDSYDKGFPAALGLLAFIPYLNICVALCALFILLITVTGAIIMLPTLIKDIRK